MKYSVNIYLEHDKFATTTVDGTSIVHALEQAFEWGNIYQPHDCRCMSVGDVVELSFVDPLAELSSFSSWQGRSKFFVCCSVGWREMNRYEFKDFIARSHSSRMMDARSRERGTTWLEEEKALARDAK